MAFHSGYLLVDQYPSSWDVGTGSMELATLVRKLEGRMVLVSWAQVVGRAVSYAWVGVGKKVVGSTMLVLLGELAAQVDVVEVDGDHSGVVELADGVGIDDVASS